MVNSNAMLAPQIDASLLDREEGVHLGRFAPPRASLAAALQEDERYEGLGSREVLGELKAQAARQAEAQVRTELCCRWPRTPCLALANDRHRLRTPQSSRHW